MDTNIPGIGGARGIFEIFVPGAFLLINFVAAVYLSPYADENTKELIRNGFSQPFLGLVVAVSFGYLGGILLRLFRTDLLDNISSVWLRIFDHRARPKGSPFKEMTYERFPYIVWIGKACELCLPTGAVDFYKKTWGARVKEGAKNDRFFNFCKVLINSIDERSASEIYLAEALSRYMSGMFFSLFLSFILALFSAVSVIIFSRTITPIFIMFLILLVFYFYAVLLIVRHFRLIRVKEVETVFDATFINRERLEASLLSQAEEPKRPAKRRQGTLRPRPVRSRVSGPHRS